MLKNNNVFAYHDEVLDVRDPSEFWFFAEELPRGCFTHFSLSPSSPASPTALLGAALCWWAADAGAPADGGGAPVAGAAAPLLLLWLARLLLDQSRTSCYKQIIIFSSENS